MVEQALPAALLTAPRRTNYFSGQLLGPDDFRREQDYHRSKQQRHNLVLLGAGVVDGLGLETAESGGVTLHPGLAIDHLGREIIVPNPVQVDPAVITDDAGTPTGETLPTGTTTIRLSYAERLEDPQPGPDGESPAVIVETYLITISAGPPADNGGSGIVLGTIEVGGEQQPIIDCHTHRHRARGPWQAQA